MKKTLAWLASGFMLALPLTAAAQQGALPDRIRAAGKVVVANQPNYPPMEYKDPATNTLKGLDIDLGLALAKELGVKVEWSDIGFEQMISSLTTGRVDLIHSGMSDLPTRRDKLDFVDYMKSGAQFFTSYARKDEFKKPDDFCGKNIGMSRRTSFPAETEKWSKENCEAKGKPAIVVVGTEGSADARTQLRQGRIDAAMQGSETLPYIMGLEPNTFALVGEPTRYTLMGIATAKEAEELRRAIVGALNALIADGTYKQLLAKWQLQPSELTEITINAGR